METIIEKKELINSYPLIERTISVNDSRITVDFELIGDLNLCLTFSKKYKNSEDALTSISKFVPIEKVKHNSFEFDNMSFKEKVLFSKKKLIMNIINNDISLPDEGKGFEYKGDIDYLKDILIQL